jgi:hypothetical protein
VLRNPADAATVFTNMVKTACSSVGEMWFQLPVSVAGEGPGQQVYRERVYCYELYHQLRLLQGNVVAAAGGAALEDFKLSAEIDKAGLNVIDNGGRHKPDLVWHVPGTNAYNAVVVEVKQAVNPSPAGIEKDLKTLTTFLGLEAAPYARGLLLFYGPGPMDLMTLVRDLAESVAEESKETIPAGLWKRIHVLHHESVHSEAVDLGAVMP